MRQADERAGSPGKGRVQFLLIWEPEQRARLFQMSEPQALYPSQGQNEPVGEFSIEDLRGILAQHF